MKTLALSVLFAAACAAAVPASMAAAQAKPKPEKFYVTVKGHMTPVSGGMLAATLTFSEPIQVPKANLPAGTYLFTLASPNIMRVTNEEGTKVYATFNTSPTSRSGNLSKAQVRFERATPGAALRLIGVYLEGTSTGYQPMYPRHGEAPVATTGTERGK